MESEIFTYINASARPGTGPMEDTRVAVESGISVENWPTDAQSRALENYVALEDATLITRLRDAGAALKGRTAMGELGLGLDGDTCGDALTKGLSDVALKIDTTGEARMAAAISGCFGFKPTYGLIPRAGLISLIPSMECCGILSNSLEAISTTTRTMGGVDERDPSMDPDGIDQAMAGFDQSGPSQDDPLIVGVIRDWHTAMGLEDKEFKAAVKKINTAAGIEIKTVDIKDFSLARTVHNIIGTVEASSSAGRFDSVRYGHRTGASVKNWNEMYIHSRGESFGPLVKAYLFQGGYFQYRDYNAFLDACRIRARLMASLEKALESVDLIVLPVAAGAVVESEASNTVSGFYDTFSLTLLANLTGNPSVSIPGAVSPGTTNGDAARKALQLIGPRFDDAGLLARASRISDILTGEV
ncbi:aspartyl-tRNA(Asn)/glutamyl-tRNA(Gln) amidotransferase subunit A [Desulfocicer vacuolatum DSM 3385]|uniref:Aspartyl-tRNA(Asn)/glutamyl-tRNA(Gln) amidotransferase subunit A n=1 Tax=Desulfocicer vacuolatum DSM 3385 TaxID=1121400 RepID=A0A1W2EBI3_9BACT|nr:amidase family protein [Desulfocicer vacuolatum]SMD06947.1 aspartyl-tRNA(Asn)/glutamyl-tRNA(Gln) amidotransferase subunit A [Desulfocicer vacuolatum DSM 3385]